MNLSHSECFENSSSESQRFWKTLNDAHIFLAGGTGFFGTSLLEGVLWSRNRFGLNTQVTVLTRDRLKFLNRYPFFQDQSWLKFCEGDVTHFSFPKTHFSHVIHGASAVSLPGQNDDSSVEQTLIDGTKHLLDFANSTGVGRFLYISSGAVYGVMPNQQDTYSETLTTQPTTSYGKGKLESERLCLKTESKKSIGLSIARGFAFVGPYLPLDSHFAIGNFIDHALRKTPITISSDGTALRSYLHTADLVTWLIALLANSKAGETYNVGSDKVISIHDLAKLVADVVSPGLEVQVLKTAVPGQAPNRYIPSVTKIKSDFDVTESVSLSYAVQQLANKHRHLKN